MATRVNILSRKCVMCLMFCFVILRREWRAARLASLHIHHVFYLHFTIARNRQQIYSSKKRRKKNRRRKCEHKWPKNREQEEEYEKKIANFNGQGKTQSHGNKLSKISQTNEKVNINQREVMFRFNFSTTAHIYILIVDSNTHTLAVFMNSPLKVVVVKSKK